MKSSTSSQSPSHLPTPTLFQIAARMEMPATFKATPSITDIVFGILNDGEIKFNLKNTEVGIATKTREVKDVSKNSTRHQIEDLKRQKKRNNFDRPENNLTLKEFHLTAPAAESVKLAADFTGWEKYPLDMIKSEDGIWFTIVPLSSGTYSYRFIVDGQWCDDPQSPQRAPNPFGTANAIVKVA